MSPTVGSQSLPHAYVPSAVLAVLAGSTFQCTLNDFPGPRQVRSVEVLPRQVILLPRETFVTATHDPSGRQDAVRGRVLEDR